MLLGVPGRVGQQQPGRADQRLGPGVAVLGGVAGRQRAAAGRRGLAGRQRPEGVQRAASGAEGGGGGAEQAEVVVADRIAPAGAGGRRREHVLLRHRVLLGHEDVVDLVVLAAGAAQPQGVPGVEHPHPGLRQEQHPDLRTAPAVGRRTLPDDPGRTDQPGRVRRAAGETPPALEPVAARHRHRLAGGVDRADHQPGLLLEQLTGGGLGQVVRDPADRGLNPHLPSHRRVQPRQCLDDQRTGRQRHLRAAELTGDQHPWQASRLECLENRQRGGALVLALLAELLDHRRDLLDPGEPDGRLLRDRDPVDQRGLSLMHGHSHLLKLLRSLGSGIGCSIRAIGDAKRTAPGAPVRSVSLWFPWCDAPGATRFSRSAPAR